VAYAIPDTASGNMSDIVLLTDWGHSMENQDKVPSVISYSLTSGAEVLSSGSKNLEKVSLILTGAMGVKLEPRSCGNS
jgi:hypothetical protein